jgi:hypothetical protein
MSFYYIWKIITLMLGFYCEEEGEVHSVSVHFVEVFSKTEVMSSLL